MCVCVCVCVVCVCVCVRQREKERAFAACPNKPLSSYAGIIMGKRILYQVKSSTTK